MTKTLLGSTTVPTLVGWSGVVITTGRTGARIGWTCPHDHRFRDMAEVCAGRAYRRWFRTDQAPR